MAPSSNNNGSSLTQVGFAGADTPAKVFPSVVGRAANNECSVGEDALAKGTNVFVARKHFFNLPLLVWSRQVFMKPIITLL